MVRLVACLGVGVLLGGCLRSDGGSPGGESWQQADQQGRGGLGGWAALPLPSTPKQFVAEAIQVAEQVVAYFPDSPQALLFGGRVYYAFGDPATANQYWEKALKLDPQFAEAWCAIGEAAWEYGQFDKAASCLQKAIAFSPRPDLKQVFLLADSLMSSGKAQQAAAVLEKVAQEHPLPPFGLFQLGNAYLHSGEYEKARQQFEAALGIEPKAINVHYGLATAYDRLGQTEKARKHRQRYAELKTEFLAESDRSRVELRKRDWADPCPVTRECHLNAGRIYATYGMLGKAEQHWLRAAALDPLSPEPRKLLEALYWQQGRGEEAVLLSRGERLAPLATQGE